MFDPGLRRQQARHASVLRPSGLRALISVPDRSKRCTRPFVFSYPEPDLCRSASARLPVCGFRAVLRRDGWRTGFTRAFPGFYIPGKPRTATVRLLRAEMNYKKYDVDADLNLFDFICKNLWGW